MTLEVKAEFSITFEIFCKVKTPFKKADQVYIQFELLKLSYINDLVRLLKRCFDFTEDFKRYRELRLGSMLQSFKAPLQSLFDVWGGPDVTILWVTKLFHRAIDPDHFHAKVKNY